MLESIIEHDTWCLNHRWGWLLRGLRLGRRSTVRDDPSGKTNRSGGISITNGSKSWWTPMAPFVCDLWCDYDMDWARRNQLWRSQPSWWQGNWGSLWDQRSRRSNLIIQHIAPLRCPWWIRWGALVLWVQRSPGLLRYEDPCNGCRDVRERGWTTRVPLEQDHLLQVWHNSILSIRICGFIGWLNSGQEFNLGWLRDSSDRNQCSFLLCSIA